MTISEAYQLLGLDEKDNPGIDLIKDKYSSVFNDLNTVLHNAPTEKLKKIYRNKLDKLEKAGRLLLGESIDIDQEKPNELPSTSPVATHSQTFHTQSTQTTAETKNRKAKKKKNVTSTALTGAIVLLLASLAANIWLYQRYQTQKTDSVGSNKVKNGTVLLKNAGKDELNIDYLKVWYLDNGDQWETYEVEPHAIKGGGRLDGSNYGPAINGNEKEWGGEVIFYQLQVSGRDRSLSEQGLWEGQETRYLNLDTRSNSPDLECGDKYIYNEFNDCDIHIFFIRHPNGTVDVTPVTLKPKACTPLPSDAIGMWIETDQECSAAPKRSEKISGASVVRVNNTTFGK